MQGYELVLPTLGIRHVGHSLAASLLALVVGAHIAKAQPIRDASVGSPPSPPAVDQALRLEDVLERALAQHPLILAANARVDAARGARRTAGALPNPVLTYWVENTPFPGQQPPSTPLDRETQTFGTLPIEPLFQRWPRVRGADADVRAAGADMARARQTVALDAARAFYRVAEAQVAVDAAEEIRARLDELLTYNRARVNEGVTAEADLIRTQVELDRVTSTATLERVELVRARAGLAPFLARATGGPADNPPNASWTPVAMDSMRVVVDDTTSSAPAAPLRSLASLLDAARSQRPDVGAARARVASASADVSYQKTLTVRQLGATFGSKTTAGVTSMVAGLSLPLPLFDQNRGEVQRSQALRVAAAQELAWTERQASAEVQAAYEAARMLAEQTARLRGTFLPRAEESRRIALAAYQEGAISLLQVLDASRTLADARQMYYRTLFAQRQSMLDLRAAVGDSLLPPSRSASNATTQDSVLPTGRTFIPTSARSPRLAGDRP